MSRVTDPNPENNYLNRVRTARNSPSVLKYKLLILRGKFPDMIVLAFEDDDDKIVYFQWIKRIRPELEYEPFPCSGKKHVMQLFDMVSRDLGDINKGIYFFIDRDFDDRIGYDDDDKVFMTDKFSVENYIVSKKVLYEVLKNEFHCHFDPDRRESICNLFDEVYSMFLESTRELNFRIFSAKRLNISFARPISDKISKIANIQINSVSPLTESPEKTIALCGDIQTDKIQDIISEFNQLDGIDRYRGKFAYSFFYKWLLLLYEDYNSTNSTIFDGLDRSSKVRISEIGLSNLASKSDLPNGLEDFVQEIRSPNQ